MRAALWGTAGALWASVALAQSPVQNRANAAVSTAPGLQILATTASQVDLCISTQTFGYGTPALGLTINSSRRDADCTRIRKAKVLQQLGFPAAGVQVMCLDRDVRAAMLAAGTPCESVKVIPE